MLDITSSPAFDAHSMMSNSCLSSSTNANVNAKKNLSYNNNRKSHRDRGKNLGVIKIQSKHRSKLSDRFNSANTNRKPSSTDANLNSQEVPFDASYMVEDHLCISIVGLLCFFPTGIFGIMRAMQAFEMKESSSVLYWPKLAALYGRQALRWAILSILIGTMWWTTFIIYRLLHEQHHLWDAFYQECGEQFLC